MGTVVFRDKEQCDWSEMRVSEHKPAMIRGEISCVQSHSKDPLKHHLIFPAAPERLPVFFSFSSCYLRKAAVGIYSCYFGECVSHRFSAQDTRTAAVPGLTSELDCSFLLHQWSASHRTHLQSNTKDIFYALVCAGLYWSRLVCLGLSWSALVCAGLCWSQLVCTDLDHFPKGVQVLLHAVVQSQIGDEVTGEHPIQTVEQRVHTSMEVDQVDKGDMTCRRQQTASQTSPTTTQHRW